MEKAYLNKNIVVIGNFTPAKFDKLFLVKSEIVQEDDFEQDSVFLPDYAQISTPNLYVQVNPDKVTINFKNPDFELEPGKLSVLLRDCKIDVLGINFKKALILDDISVSRDFFYFEKNRLNSFFEKDESVYGYFVSRDFEDYRLNLNIKPMKLQRVGEPEVHDALDFSFNFRFSGSDILQKIDVLQKYEEITDNIIGEYDRID